MRTFSLWILLAACGGAPSPAATAPIRGEQARSGASSSAPRAAEDRGDTPLRLLDFVVMNEGYGPADRAAYTAEVQAIARAHGVTLAQSYRVDQVMAGEVDGVLDVNIWRVPGPEALQALGEDPRYQALTRLRDRIHDMSKLTLYLAEPVTEVGQLRSEHVLVDLVFLNEGADLRERASYVSDITPIARRHGARPVQTYRILRHLAGRGEGAVELNLWEVDSPGALQATLADPDYQAHIARRDRIHDMGRLTMMLAHGEPR